MRVLYHGHCECGRRHTYDNTGVYIPGTDDLRLDKPIKCKCGRLLYILGFGRGKTFFGEDNSETIYLNEKRPVPSIHQAQKPQSYWRVRDQREAQDRYLSERVVNQDKMKEAPLPKEKRYSVSDHPVSESLGIGATLVLGVLAAFALWSLLLH